MSETETNGVDRVRELLNGHVAAGPAKEPRLNHDESDGWDDGGFYNATKDPQSESDGNSASDHEEPADERTRGSADDQRTGRRPWHRCPDLVEEILSRANEPWVSLTLAADEIVSVRAGGIVVVMGPTGAGKTSLVAGMLVAHARNAGPVVVLSRELPADSGARAIGMQCDASWPDVLTGKVPRPDMERSLALPRMLVLDRRAATLTALVSAIKTMKTECAGEPVLAVVDYVQIIESQEREARSKVADVIAQIDEIARAHRVVVIAISQMSRAAYGPRAGGGEAVGADSTDGGAESAAIERAASVTLSIGSAGPDT